MKLKGKVSDVVTSALVNSGFEAEEPQIVVPLRLAELLGLTETPMAIEDLSVAGGGKTLGYRVEEALVVELILGDREPVEAKVTMTILPGEDEAILSDNLSSKLNIAIIDPHRGLWCLKDEIGKKVRTSVKPEKWH